MLEEKIKFIIRSRALIIHDKKLLVVKHRETDQYYATPGGHMETGENPLDCIKREIFEEFGVEISNPKLGYIYNWNGNNEIPNIELFFVVERGDDFVDIENIKNKNRSHAFEIYDIKWVDKDSTLNILPKNIWQDLKENNFDVKEIKFMNN